MRCGSRRRRIFGPWISAIPFTDIDEVLERGNATPFGLGSGVWTRDVSKALSWRRGLRAGSVWVNCYQAMDPAVPFGGYKMSGYGREGGIQHVEEYLNVKAVWIKTRLIAWRVPTLLRLGWLLAVLWAAPALAQSGAQQGPVRIMAAGSPAGSVHRPARRVQGAGGQHGPAGVRPVRRAAAAAIEAGQGKAGPGADLFASPTWRSRAVWRRRARAGRW